MTKRELVGDDLDEWTHAYDVINQTFGPPPHENLPAWTRLIMRERAAAREEAEEKLDALRETAERVMQELRWANDSVMGDPVYRKDDGSLADWCFETLADKLAAAIEASK